MKMRGILNHLFWLILILGLGCRRPLPVPTTTYRQILDRMADPYLIADLSQPGSMLFSSSDPTGGNDDFGHFLRNGPSGWKVLAKVKGTGYMSRFWCTGAESGEKRIRIYVDNDRKPAIETTWDDWFGRAGQRGNLPMSGYEPYCWFSWLPVSFSRSFTIMQENPVGDEKLYYQININLMPEGEVAESWNPRFLADTGIQDHIESLKSAWGSAQATKMDGMGEGMTIPPGAALTVWSADGADIIETLQVAVQAENDISVAERETLLRSLIIRMYWDGVDAPSVNAPIGALGGSMWREIQYGSAYFGMSGGVYRIAFPMPFRKGARIDVLNESRMRVQVATAVKVSGENPSDALGYFHANWRKSTADRVGHPHVIARVYGRGKYVGCQLGVRSLDRSWWALESDEFIYVDGEPIASWLGTGLEDYFNGGWYYGNPLASPFHGIVFKALARAQQYRLHPFDPVTFNSRLHMEFERGPGNISNAEMESVAYYYLDRPVAADSDLRDPAYRQPVTDPLAMYTLMTEVLNMERMRDVPAAINTLRDYLVQYPENPFHEVLERRMRNYIAPPEIEAGKGVLGLYANAPSRVFLNGVPVLGVNTDKGDRVHFRDVNLSSGTNVIAVQFSYRPYPDWVQVMLEYPGGFMGTDHTWRYAFNPSGISWARVGFDDSDWPLHGSTWVKGPPEVPFVWCEPNDRPWTQSRAWGIRSPVEWPTERGVLVFRKVFTVERHEEEGASVPRNGQ